jgi:DNA-binding SARP family transcriptional activator
MVNHARIDSKKTSGSVRLFGHPLFQDQTQTIVPLNEKALGLLACLILRRHRGPLRRKALAFELWPDLTESDACATLRRMLHQIMGPLSGSNLFTDATWVYWNVDTADVFVDVIAFEQLSDDPRTRASAADLYRGDLLETLECDWMLRERERFRSMQYRNLRETAAFKMDRADWDGALDLMQRMETLDPWREEVLREKMTLRYLRGDRAGALREYALFEARLREELGVQPMPETMDCREMIARGECPTRDIAMSA